MSSAFGAGSLVSATASLVIILGLLAAALFVARRLRSAQGFLRNSRTAPINIIATRALGPQTALLIIEAEGQIFLIGTSRGGMTAIGRLGATTAEFANVYDSAADDTAGP
jgi:flagellar biogenesis protein FliO